MGSPLLVLRLEGPLQSWGLQSRWDVRDSGGEPSKSGVVGLLGCALGYPMRDPRLVDLDRRLVMGVRTERAGTRLYDFHTVTGVFPTAKGGTQGSRDDPYTVVSRRTYLQDAAFLVVLSGPKARLETCRDALVHPRWPVYLGRKSCPPVRPVLEALVDDYSSVEEALARYPWDAGGWDDSGARVRSKVLRCTLEDPSGPANRPDRVTESPARLYGNRAVRVFSVDVPVAPVVNS